MKLLDKYLKVPYALGVGEWNKWNTKTKKEHPIAWFFYHDVNRYLSRKWYWVTRQYWKLQHRYNPKHQYNKLDTGLELGYYDPSESIKGAIFTAVVKYCNDNQFVWDEDYTRCQIRLDLQKISDWHTRIRPRLEELNDSLYGEKGGEILGYFDCGLFSPDDRMSKKTSYIEAKIDRIDEKMMHLAIKHLKQMWY